MIEAHKGGTSKQYSKGGFWYAYHPAWDEFLRSASVGLLVLGCLSRNEACALPRDWIHSRLRFLNTTEMEDETYWHLYLNPHGDGSLALRLNAGQEESLESFRLIL